MLVGISLASGLTFSRWKISPENKGNRTDERYSIQAADFRGCLTGAFARNRIGAGANARRNAALRDRSIGQYARPEYCGYDTRVLCGESFHLRPAGVRPPQAA